jgi:hypothetical protein
MAYTFAAAAMRDPGNKLSRRRALQAGVVVVLAACGAAAGVLRTGGYAVPPGRRLEGLRAWQFVVVQHVARRIAAPDRPSVPTADEVDVAGFVDAYMARAPAAMRRDLNRLLACIEHMAPLLLGLVSRFTRLSAEGQDRVLAALEASSSDLLRAGFDAIKSLVFMGYYRDPRTWSIVGYDGPLIGRPSGGAWH